MFIYRSFYVPVIIESNIDRDQSEFFYVNRLFISTSFLVIISNYKNRNRNYLLDFYSHIFTVSYACLQWLPVAVNFAAFLMKGSITGFGQTADITSRQNHQLEVVFYGGYYIAICWSCLGSSGNISISG